MNRAGLAVLLLLLTLGSPVALAAVTTTATTATSTETGWNIPSTNGLSAGMLPIIFPLLFGVMFVSIPIIMRRPGDFCVTLLLLGMAFGSTFGTAYTASVPLAETIALWATFGLWLWQSGQLGSYYAPEQSGDSDWGEF